MGGCSSSIWSYNRVSLLFSFEMQVLGADGLLYQSIDDLLAVAQSLNPDIQQFEASCFTGEEVHFGSLFEIWDDRHSS